MANANLNITISGNGKGLKDALSQARAAVLDFSKDAEKIDVISETFEAVAQSTMPLQMKLKAIKQMMSEMNAGGMSNTDLFGHMAEEAGSIADAIGDARTAVNAFANDNMKLEAMAQGFQLITGGASVLTGAMSMLGIENEKVQNAMLKVQSAIALVNGVTAIANVLNKDSAFMLRLKQIRISANTAATTTNTVATKTNTTAEVTNNVATKAGTVATVGATAATVANTVATSASTVAKNAWNMAVAVGKALFGDFTGLVLVGAAALTAYALATSDSTKEVEKNNDAISEGKKRMDDYNSAVASNCGSMVASYQSLKTEFEKLQTVAEKTQWIKDNQSEFNKLGLSVDDLTTAERIFVGDTSKVVKALEARAKAMAAQNALTDAYTEFYKTKMNNANSVEGGGYYYAAKAGKGYEQDSSVMNDLTRVMRRNGDVTATGDAYNENGKYYTMSKGKFVLTEYGAQQVNQLRNNESLERLNANNIAAQQELDRTLNFYNTEIENAAKEIDALGLSNIVNTDNNSSNNNSNNTNSNKSNRTEKIDYLVSVDDGSLDTAEKKLQAFASKKKQINIDDTEALTQVNKDIQKWSREVILRRIALEGDDNIKAVVSEISELENQKDEIKIQINTADSEERVAELNRELDNLNNKLLVNYIKIGITPEIEEGSVVDIESKIKQLENVRKVLLQTVADPESIKAVDDEIKNLKNQLESEEIRLGIKPVVESGSLNEIKKLIKDKEDEISLALNTNIDPESMQKLQNELRALRKQESDKEIELGIKTASATISKQETQFVRGSVEDKKQSLMNANSMVSEIQENYRLKLIGKDEVETQLAEINSKLEELGLKPITLTFNDDGTLTTAAEDLERFKDQMDSVKDVSSKVGSAFGSLGSAIGGTTGEVLNFAGQSISALGQIIPEIATMIAAKNAEAVAAGTASAAAMPFPANIASIAMIVAQIASVFAALPAFETGGVVGGNSYHGDKILARVNSGELILNKLQQNRLYNSLSAAEVGATANTLRGEVDFKISGSTLHGCLKNYDSKMKNIK